MPDDNVKLELSKSEALVLFEFLSRFSNPPHKLEIQDQAEGRVLWDMCCYLEKRLAEPFDTDYRQILQKARDIVRDKG
jgi:hypothetical protein